MKVIQFQRPALTPWPNVSRLAGFSDAIDRLFESSFEGFSPALEVHEDKENLVVKAELPGINKDDVQVSLQDGTLTISGERKREAAREDAVTYHTERCFGRFQRSLTLPADVAADKVKAQYKDGVLTITLPKTEAAKPRQIDVSVN